MKKLESLDQLKVGTKLKIIAKSDRDTYGSVSVKKIIPMRRYVDGVFSEPYDHEILINRTKNYFFSMNAYLNGESQWVVDVFVLDGIDKRLKRFIE